MAIADKVNEVSLFRPAACIYAHGIHTAQGLIVYIRDYTKKTPKIVHYTNLISLYLLHHLSSFLFYVFFFL
jgi:hypothetical protein